MRVLEIFVLIVCAVLLTASVVWCKIVHVPDDSSTIQAGINGAIDGDTVLVAEGLYKGQGNRDIDFLAKRITVISEHGAEATIINSEGNSENYHRGFNFHSGEQLDSYLEGFTITGGYARDGGGISCSGSSSPTIINCIIEENAVGWSGGGIYCKNSSPEVIDCILTANESEYGTIMCSGDNATPTIRNCWITENTADWGGAVYCSNSSPIIEHCLITDNYARLGTIECYDTSSPHLSRPQIKNCTISGNRGGLFFSGYSYPAIIECNISNNTGIGGIWCYQYANAQIINCTIVGNESDGVYFRSSSGSIRNCYIENNDHDGILCYGAHPEIKNCTITGHKGRGIECVLSSPTIDSCTISGNSPIWGGGIYCANSSPKITNCNILENTASRGAGIYCSASSPEISSCLIKGNVAVEGGGLYCNGFSFPPVISNCIFHMNSAEKGGGTYCDKYSFPIFINCTFIGNIADSTGGAMYSNVQPYYPTIVNSIFWDNLPNEIFPKSGNPEDVVITYSDIRGSWPGEGNIDSDPLFRDPENGDYHLMATYCGDPYDSPCIDAGHPDSLDSILDCWHGLGTERADMGAYGGGNAGWPTSVVENDLQSGFLPREYILYQNFPNPFNAKTEISYQIPRSGIAALRIYNILGQLVMTLIDTHQEAGKYSVIWNAAEFTSGIYFAMLEAGGYSKTIKMVLLK